MSTIEPAATPAVTLYDLAREVRTMATNRLTEAEAALKANTEAMAGTESRLQILLGQREPLIAEVDARRRRIAEIDALLADEGAAE